MANVNKVHLIGRITQDIDLRHTKKNIPVTSLNLAVNRFRTDENGDKAEETTFIEVVLWSRLAELAHQYLDKGREVYIDGRLELKSWEDRETGQKRSKIQVVGENMQFIGSMNNGADSSKQYTKPPVSKAPATIAQDRPSLEQTQARLDQLPGDDIPF